jgi:hypothetical protein
LFGRGRRDKVLDKFIDFKTKQMRHRIEEKKLPMATREEVEAEGGGGGRREAAAEATIAATSDKKNDGW